MNGACQNFVDLVLTELPQFADVVSSVFEDWQPDDPPTTVLFGEIGRQIADHFGGLAADQRNSIFRLVETAVSSEDVDLRAAAATGLLEALVSRASRSGALGDVMSVLGPASLEYTRAWNT